MDMEKFECFRGEWWQTKNFMKLKFVKTYVEEKQREKWPFHPIGYN